MKKGIGGFRSIRTNLIASFMVPVAFVILLGVVSYVTASGIIINNYIEAYHQNMVTISEYIELGLQSVESVSVQFGTDEKLNKYLLNLYGEGSVDENAFYNGMNRTMISASVANEFISRLLIVSDKKPSIA